MHNTYICSAISLRTKGSLPFSPNDYPYFFNGVYDKTPPSSSSSSYCACCCAFPIHCVPINPSILYGSRQSTLIHFSASRKVILAGGNQYCSRFPVHDLNPGCCDMSWSSRERGGSRRRGRRMKGRQESRRHQSGVAGDDAEAMLSLLTEDVSEKCLGVRERNGSSFRKGRVKERGDVVNGCFGGKNKGGLLESNLKIEFESRKIRSSKEENRPCEGKEDSSSLQNHRLRNESSSCSSYYSFSSSGEFENNTEVQMKHGGSVGVSPIGFTNDLGRTVEGRYDVEGLEHDKKCRNDVQGHEEVMEEWSSAVRSDMDVSGIRWDWRKKSEKKLAEIVTDESITRKPFSDKGSIVHGGKHQSGSTEVLSSHKDERNDESNFDVRTRKHYSQVGTQVSRLSESSKKYEQLVNSETASWSEQKVSTREEDLVVNANLSRETREKTGQKDRYVSHEHKSGRNTKQLTNTSEMHVRTSNSNRLSETSRSKQEENATFVLSSDTEMKDQYHQTGQCITRQIDSRRNFPQSTEILDFESSQNEGTSASQKQFDSTVKNREENLNLVFSSWSKSGEQQSKSDQEAIKRTESRKESQDVTSTSIVQAVDAKSSIKSFETSEKRMSSQESYSTPVMTVDVTRDRHDRADGRVQIELRKEAQKPRKLSSSRKAISKEGSRFQESLGLVGQARMVQSGMDEEGKRSSQPIVIPPLSQLVTSASPARSNSGFSMQEVSREISRSGSSALYTHPQEIKLDVQPKLQDRSNRDELQDDSSRSDTFRDPLNLISHGDVLGSAARLDSSSMKFVGEFVEKVQSEASTSEGGKHKQNNNLGNSLCDDFKPSESDSMPSSGGFGVKGPLDDMWDVVNPTVQDSSKTEASEETATVKRSRGSLWSIIAGIVRWRWASHGYPHNSAVKLGGRSSSNESVSSDTWFSGHEQDENSGENARRRSKPQEPPSLQQMMPAKSPSQRKRLDSDARSSKDKLSDSKVDVPSSSSILEVRPASEGISSASGYENIDWIEDGKSFLGTSSIPAVVESSLPLPTKSIRSPIVGETLDTENADVSGKDSIKHIEKPISTRPIKLLGTEENDGELKRRKFQRKDQLSKDSFDEWEEAYKFESEQRKIDEMFMREALLEARKAADTWDVPVGAVLVQNGKVIARGCNLVEELRDSTAHAEMICIREASNLLRSWRLVGTTLYVTLEPCPMCAGAILQARINTVVWGAPNKLLGADGSWIRLFPDGGEGGNDSELTDKPAAPVHPFHPKMTIRRRVLESDCADAMQQFFKLRRRKKEKKPEPPTSPLHLHVSHHPSKFLSKIHNIFHIIFCL